MKKYIKNILSIAVLIISATVAVDAQTNKELPFSDEIKAFKKQDSIVFPAKHSVLFVGSSSFRKWTNVQQYFPAYKIINRGFGGSTIPDVIQYADDIIFPYHPKQIVIYCGENDIASSDSITAEIMFERFEKLFLLIRSKLKKVEIDFVSIKPSPSRLKFKATVENSNKLIKAYISKQSHAKFINVFNAMLHEDGSIKQDIFLDDSLHMNNKGYAIWQTIFQPYLLK